jgi:hypothetical protein
MLTRDLRMAGYISRFQVVSALDWDADGQPNDLVVEAQDNVAAGIPDVAPGTDIVTVVYAGPPHELQMGATNEFGTGTNIVLASLDFDGDGFQDIGLTGPSQMPFGVIYDFTRATAFQVNGQAGSTLNVLPNIGSYPSGSYVSRLNIVRYWVDNQNTQGAADALDPVMPRLCRRNLGRDLGVETVAENIENLQVQYGLDTDNDGAVDTWSDALAGIQSRQVIEVRVWVLGRNATPRPPGYVDNTAGQMGNTVLAPAGLFARQLLNSRVRIRN